MDWDEVSFVLRSKTRKAVLCTLESPKTPTLVARELGISTPNVSRALRELLSHDLIESLTPEARSGKLLVATKHGREVTSKLREVSPGVRPAGQRT